MQLIKEFLTHKGWITTIMGMLIGFPVGIRAVQRYFILGELAYQEIVTICVLFGIVVLLVILPSEITLDAGKFKFSIKD